MLQKLLKSLIVITLLSSHSFFSVKSVADEFEDIDLENNNEEEPTEEHDHKVKWWRSKRAGALCCLVSLGAIGGGSYGIYKLVNDEKNPTGQPSPAPSASPSFAPTRGFDPQVPTARPTFGGTELTDEPTFNPTAETSEPTPRPTPIATLRPTPLPTPPPTFSPTFLDPPTSRPVTGQPSDNPLPT